jgi:hypothetical protein
MGLRNYGIGLGFVQTLITEFVQGASKSESVEDFTLCVIVPVII